MKYLILLTFIGQNMSSAGLLLAAQVVTGAGGSSMKPPPAEDKSIIGAGYKRVGKTYIFRFTKNHELLRSQDLEIIYKGQRISTLKFRRRSTTNRNFGLATIQGDFTLPEDQIPRTKVRVSDVDLTPALIYNHNLSHLSLQLASKQVAESPVLNYYGLDSKLSHSQTSVKIAFAYPLQISASHSLVPAISYEQALEDESSTSIQRGDASADLKSQLSFKTAAIRLAHSYTPNPLFSFHTSLMLDLLRESSSTLIYVDDDLFSGFKALMIDKSQRLDLEFSALFDRAFALFFGHRLPIAEKISLTDSNLRNPSFQRSTTRFGLGYFMDIGGSGRRHTLGLKFVSLFHKDKMAFLDTNSNRVEYQHDSTDYQVAVAYFFGLGER